MAITDSIIRYRRFLKRKNVSPNTVKNYLHGLKHFVLWLDMPVETVTHRKIAAYVDYMISQRLKPKTVNCYLNSVCQFYHYLADEEGIQIVNPVKKPNIMKLPRGLPKHLKDEQIALLFNHLKGCRDQAMFMIMLRCGLRVEEVANLSMICGNVGIEGGGVNPLRGQNNVQGACDMGGLPNVYPAYQQVANEDVRKKFEAVWNAKLSPKPGLTIMEMMDAAGKGTIKALYIMGENPMLSDPDLHHVKKELQKLDLMIVQDLFMTETAQLADVVLPVASFAEKDGTFSNTERRVQRIRKAVQAPGEAKADWEVICGISNKMGYAMKYASAKEIFEEVAKVTPSYAGISYERLEKGGIQWPCPTQEHQGTKFLHKDKFSRGLGLFTAIEYIAPNEMPDKQYPFLLSTGRVLYHYHTGTMTTRAEGLNERCPESLVEINPVDAEKMKISEGQRVKVTSRRGSVEAKATITQKSAPGSIFMNFHFADASVNLLTNPALDPIGKIPEYKVCAVKVEAA